MKAFAASTFAFALAALTVPAAALPPTGSVLTTFEKSQVETVDFAQGHEILARAPRGRASAAMAEQYFAADLGVTLAALALTGGAFVAYGLSRRRRRASPVAAPLVAQARDWEAGVMQALEADLAEFAYQFRRAA